jgi:hypothetical protein
MPFGQAAGLFSSISHDRAPARALTSGQIAITSFPK